MKNGKKIRRTGGSETTKWSQPGSRFAALRGLRGVPKESVVPPRRSRWFPLEGVGSPLYFGKTRNNIYDTCRHIITVFCFILK